MHNARVLRCACKLIALLLPRFTYVIGYRTHRAFTDGIVLLMPLSKHCSFDMGLGKESFSAVNRWSYLVLRRIHIKYVCKNRSRRRSVVFAYCHGKKT